MAKNNTGESGGAATSIEEPNPSTAHEELRAKPANLKHLREISLTEAKALGMFTEPVTIISPVPTEKAKPLRTD